MRWRHAHPGSGGLCGMLLCLALAGTSIAAAPLLSFSADVGGERRGATVAELVRDGVSYVSLTALTSQLGGGSRILPERVQVDLAGNTAVLRIADTQVEATQRRFTLLQPVVQESGDVLIALSDAANFFSMAFGVALRREEAPAPTPEPTAAAPVSPPVPSEPTASPPAAEFSELGLEAAAAPPIASMPLPPAETLDASTGVVVVDAGHGGNDAGYVPQGGPAEKALTLAVAQRVRQILKEKTGLNALATRVDDRDLTLSQRAHFIKQQAVDLVVSVHAGASFSPNARGVEVFYTAAGGARGEQAARAIADALRANAQVPLRGVHEVPLRLIDEAGEPGVLVEVGCLSNTDEALQLRSESYQTRLAEAIARGIEAAMRGVVEQR